MIRKLVARLRRSRAFVAAAAASTAAIVVAASGGWVFRPRTAHPEASVWRLILADRSALGFLRLAIVGVALYVVASVAVFIVEGRWLKSFSTSGFEPEAAFGAESRLANLEIRLQKAEEDRDEAMRLLWGVLHG